MIFVKHLLLDNYYAILIVFRIVFIASKPFAESKLMKLDLAQSSWKEQAIKGNTRYVLSEVNGEQAP